MLSATTREGSFVVSQAWQRRRLSITLRSVLQYSFFVVSSARARCLTPWLRLYSHLFTLCFFLRSYQFSRVQAVQPLIVSAKDAARDIDPKDVFRNLRVRFGEKELIVATASDSVIIVVQRWDPFVPKN